MTDELAINFGGLQLKNPLIVASSELTNTLSKIKEAERHGAAAVSTKLCFLQVPFYARPYHIVERGSALFSPSGLRLSVGEAQDLIRRAKRETSEIKIIANMMGPGDDVAAWARLGAMLEEAGADMLELNMSCPNVGVMARELGVPATAEMGAVLGQNPALAGAVTKAVVEAVSIPVMPKMTPEANTSLVAAECWKNGAAAISGINCPQSLPGVNIYDDGKPRYPTVSNQAFSGLCGPWIRPLAYRHIAQMAMKMPNLQIAGGGGLTNWRQSVEMIMYGASALTYCSVLYFRGFKVITDIEAGLRQFIREQGYKHLHDFRGMALKHIVTPDKVGYIPALPSIDNEKCDGCGICVRPAHCEVLGLVEKKAAVVNAAECTACSVCYWLCPRDAIRMVPTESAVPA